MSTVFENVGLNRRDVSAMAAGLAVLGTLAGIAAETFGAGAVVCDTRAATGDVETLAGRETFGTFATRALFDTLALRAPGIVAAAAGLGPIARPMVDNAEATRLGWGADGTDATRGAAASRRLVRFAACAAESAFVGATRRPRSAIGDVTAGAVLGAAGVMSMPLIGVGLFATAAERGAFATAAGRAVETVAETGATDDTR